MANIRWDPFREMTQVQNQFNRLVDQVWNNRQESWLPAVDVFDRKDAVVLKAELAGMDPADIEIEVEGFTHAVLPLEAGRDRGPVAAGDHGSG